MCVSAKLYTFLCKRRDHLTPLKRPTKGSGAGVVVLAYTSTNALSDRGDAIPKALHSPPTILFAPWVCKHLGVGEVARWRIVLIFSFSFRKELSQLPCHSRYRSKHRLVTQMYIFPSPFFQLSPDSDTWQYCYNTRQWLTKIFFCVYKTLIVTVKQEPSLVNLEINIALFAPSHSRFRIFAVNSKLIFNVFKLRLFQGCTRQREIGRINSSKQQQTPVFLLLDH